MQTMPFLTPDFSTLAATWAVMSITSPKPWVETSNAALWTIRRFVLREFAQAGSE